ncbi:hypothetical protein PIB30_011158 [Stylosanthes scabra]|uniref:Uncharacterized protein n=1 Tax=Stylosanthes scabra TaxID=79078 RepID=A0ABU6Q6S5_9FABA|nr:hypothetical protein [Stylosanthes scabra]
MNFIWLGSCYVELVYKELKGKVRDAVISLILKTFSFEIHVQEPFFSQLREICRRQQLSHCCCSIESYL